MPNKPLVKRTRKPRDPFREKVEKAVTHVTEEQFVARHLHCVYIGEIWRAQERGEYVPANAKPVCNHPEDGVCGTWISPEELKKVNDRLSGVESEASQAEHPVKVRIRQRATGPQVVKYFCMKCEDWHTLDPDPLKLDGIYGQHFSFKRQRGQRLPSQLKPKKWAKFFCMQCNGWHSDDPISRDRFVTHAKYKRKRGRQKGWKLTLKSESGTS